MTTVDVILPKSLRTFVEKQVASGQYSSMGEYMRELVRKENDRVRMRETLLEGAASEPAIIDTAYFEGLRSKARSLRRK